MAFSVILINRAQNMNIEERIFNKGTVDVPSLLAFGFQPIAGGYEYHEVFLDDQFEAVVFIDEQGKAQGKVLDLNMDGEEYEAIHVDAFAGGFVGSVKEAYADILKRIRASCFRVSTFASAQANRLEKLIFEAYGERPDFPFSEMENYGVFRVPSTNKWYGLIMQVGWAKLYKDTNLEGTVDVLNLKIDETKRDELFAIDGILPAYHMNHKSWASVLLDDRVDDGLIMSLIDVSRTFALSNKKKKAK